MTNSTCRPETIFESQTVDIQYCTECRSVHLTMGSITIRMSEHHFSQLAQDMGRGLFAMNVGNNHPMLKVMM